MLKLRLLACIILLTGIWACTPKISDRNTDNRYLQNFNNHILNDSLQLHITTPADIKYVVSKKLIERSIKEKKIKTVNPVLVYGTTTDPSYQFLVTIGTQKEKPRPNQLILDTMVNQHSLHFIGANANDRALTAMKIDLQQIFNSIKSGSRYMQDTGSVMSLVNRSMTSNMFLKNLTEIKQYPIPKNQGNSLELQMQLTFASFLGNNSFYSDLIKQTESSFKPKDSIVNVIKNNLVVNDGVLDSIIVKARLTNVVMLNENHFYPAHRSFILDLLPKLRSEGYTHLALEALAAPYDSILNEPSGFPVLKTGFYTQEQTYGNLLREAKTLGYHFVAYENENNNKNRELGQAENLYRKTIGTDKHAKVVVIAGVDHILERATASGKKWMATLFKELYQINPLTISQTHLNLYRNQSAASIQLISKNELNGIANIASVDYFLLNKRLSELSLWKEKSNYANRFDHVVQVSLFYQKEMKKENDYHQNTPYFTALVPINESVEIPYNSDSPATVVVYDELGNVLEKKSLN